MEKDPPTPPDGGVQRYKRVKDMRTDISSLIVKRKEYCRKYGKAVSNLENVSTVFSSLAVIQSTTGVVTTFTVVGMPIGTVLTVLGAVSGLISLTLTPITKQYNKKKLKHDEKHTILRVGMSEIDRKLSRHLVDNFIDEDEFDEIVDEYNKIRQKLVDYDKM